MAQFSSNITSKTTTTLLAGATYPSIQIQAIIVGVEVDPGNGDEIIQFKNGSQTAPIWSLLSAHGPGQISFPRNQPYRITGGSDFTAVTGGTGTAQWTVTVIFKA